MTTRLCRPEPRQASGVYERNSARSPRELRPKLRLRRVAGRAPERSARDEVVVRRSLQLRARLREQALRVDHVERRRRVRLVPLEHEPVVLFGGGDRGLRDLETLLRAADVQERLAHLEPDLILELLARVLRLALVRVRLFDAGDRRAPVPHVPGERAADELGVHLRERRADGVRVICNQIDLRRELVPSEAHAAARRGDLLLDLLHLDALAQRFGLGALERRADGRVGLAGERHRVDLGRGREAHEHREPRARERHLRARLDHALLGARERELGAEDVVLADDARVVERLRELELRVQLIDRRDRDLGETLRLEQPVVALDDVEADVAPRRLSANLGDVHAEITHVVLLVNREEPGERLDHRRGEVPRVLLAHDEGRAAEADRERGVPVLRARVDVDARPEASTRFPAPRARCVALVAGGLDVRVVAHGLGHALAERHFSGRDELLLGRSRGAERNDEGPHDDDTTHSDLWIQAVIAAIHFMNQDSPMAAALKKDRLRARLRVAVRDSILEAAERAIVEEGLEGASLLSIARRAGVAVGTIYNYFVDRQELFRELFTTRKTELVTAVDSGMKSAASKPFEAQLEAFARIFLESYDARRD